MKIIQNDGKLWASELSKNIFSLGLSQEHFNAMGVVWVFVPSGLDELKTGDPLAHYESNKGLGSLRAPFPCTVLRWNNDLLDTPDKITPDQHLVTVRAT
jgi:glycine cleavage system H lipoate-binding protein